MAEMNDVVKLAVDLYNGTVKKYSNEEASETLREALIAANNGSTKLDYKAIRDGKCNGLFSIVEEILKQTVVTNIESDAFFKALVDFRNVAAGDSNVFVLEDTNLYVVSDVADGTQGIRRQRLGGSTDVTVPTQMRMVRIYEELNRVLSGRVDFNHLIDLVAESFRQKIMTDVYTLWENADQTSLGSVYYTAGNYSETDLLTLIEHVEAAAGGKPATLLGTKAALRALKPSIESEVGKTELHDLGYYGKFYGSPVVVIPQRHEAGTTTFAVDDTVITVVAGDEKPIKFVYEGDPIVLMGDPMTNADLTQEYLYGEKYGIAMAMAGGNSGIGKYDMT